MITIFVGRSGSGKDYAAKTLIDSGEAEKIVTYTTRPPRPNEADGVSYNFVTEQAFAEMVESGHIFEYVSFNTPRGPVMYGSGTVDAVSKDFAVVLELDGAQKYLEHYGREECLILEIYADKEVRRERAFDRKFKGMSPTEDEISDFYAEWAVRDAEDDKIFDEARLKSLINCRIYNQNDADEKDLPTASDIPSIISLYKEHIEKYISEKRSVPHLVVKAKKHTSNAIDADSSSFAFVPKSREDIADIQQI